MTSPDLASLDAFLARVVELSPAQFDAVRAAGRAIGPARRIAARKAAKLSASEFSALDTRVRDRLQPRSAELMAFGDGALAAAVADTLFAAHAKAFGERLSAEEREILLQPFAAVLEAD